MKILLFALFFNSFTHHLSAQKSINFTFHNGSLKSIPLVIPTVMNPNLSPMSNSGITLDMGQVVYFFSNGNKGKKEVLFVVNEAFKDGDVLEIDQLISEKKKALQKQ